MNMPDYQKMYLTLIAATEDAINSGRRSAGL